MRRSPAPALSLCCTIAIARVAVAQAAPAPAPIASLDLDTDGDGRPERIRLQADGSLRLLGGMGSTDARLALWTLPASLGAASLRAVQTEGHTVLHVRVAHARGRGALEAAVRVEGALPRLIWAGATGPVGDGERIERLRVGSSGIFRSQASPGVTRCDGADELFVERWAFASGAFVPQEVPPPGGPALHATATRPRDWPARPLGVYRFVAASTQPQAAGRADRLAAPRELEDGRPDTAWVAGPPGEGRGAWVTARSRAKGARLRGLAVLPGPGAPRALAIITEQGNFSLTLPLHPGATLLYVELPALLATGCVSVAIATPGSGAPTSLAEVSLYAESDGPDGIERLAAAVARGEPGADGAAQTLAEHGAAAARAIEAALAAHPTGRRRLVGVLVRLQVAEAARPLGRALQSATEEERDQIVTALAALGAPALPEAARLVSDGAQAMEARIDGARVLGRLAATAVNPETGAEAAQLLVELAGRAPTGLSGAVVQALARAAAEQPGMIHLVAAELSALCRGEELGEPARAADLARALGPVTGLAREPARSLAITALACAWRVAPTAETAFAPRLRLLRALSDASVPELEAPLAEAALQEREPVLRALAVAALRGGAASRLAEQIAADRDPGVRKAAMGALAERSDPEVTQVVVRVLGQDRWPMVRAAAAEALGRTCARRGPEAAQALRRALLGAGPDRAGADPAESVRRAALVAFSECGAIPLDELAELLRAAAHPLSLRQLAAALLGKAGGPRASELLAEELDAVLADPGGDERASALAVALLRALGRAGSSPRRVLEALGAAIGDPSSAAVRAAAIETVGRLCPEGAEDGFRRGAADPDGTVRRATAAARARCRRR